MKMPDYDRGYRDATRAAVTWLHAEAQRMGDPNARAILNTAAYGLGVAHSRAGPSLPADKPTDQP